MDKGASRFFVLGPIVEPVDPPRDVFWGEAFSPRAQLSAIRGAGQAGSSVTAEKGMLLAGSPWPSGGGRGNTSLAGLTSI